MAKVVRAAGAVASVAVEVKALDSGDREAVVATAEEGPEMVAAAAMDSSQPASDW